MLNNLRDTLAPTLEKIGKGFASTGLSPNFWTAVGLAFAPGVGNPEAVGLTSRELFDLIYSFNESKVVGVDIMELNPYHDNGSTASLAAKIMSTMIAMNLSQNK